MKPELVNCKKCGTLLQKNKRNICAACAEKEKELIKIISEFVESYPEPTVTLLSISENTGIDIAEIEEIYTSSLLLTYVTNKILAKCKICLKEFKGSEMKGYFCDECLKREGLGECDPSKIKVELKTFQKNVMHTKIKDNTPNKGFKSRRTD